MKILITGIAGLLGSRLADWILENTENFAIPYESIGNCCNSSLNGGSYLFP